MYHTNTSQIQHLANKMTDQSLRSKVILRLNLDEISFSETDIYQKRQFYGQFLQQKEQVRRKLMAIDNAERKIRRYQEILEKEIDRCTTYIHFFRNISSSPAAIAFAKSKVEELEETLMVDSRLLNEHIARETEKTKDKAILMAEFDFLTEALQFILLSKSADIERIFSRM